MSDSKASLNQMRIARLGQIKKESPTEAQSKLSKHARKPHQNNSRITHLSPITTTTLPSSIMKRLTQFPSHFPPRTRTLSPSLFFPLTQRHLSTSTPLPATVQPITA